HMGVSSERGKGSTFWFTVRFAHASRPPEDAGVSAARARLEGLPVLVVDDNATNRAVLEQSLAGWGMRPAAAADAAQALRMLHDALDRGEPYPMAILDFQMPGMDGLELASTISADPAMAPTRLVLLTSTAGRAEVRSAEQAGVQAFLSKPVRQSVLYECLATVMGLEEGPTPAPMVTHRSLVETKARARAHLLVVEDNIVNQKVAARMLEKLGHRVDVAANGLEAVEAVARARYAAVLMDCQMPEMDGYQATREIRRREGPEQHTPIIAMTAGALKGEEEKCLAAGMDAYLSKPVTLEALAATLERWLPAAQPTALDSPEPDARRSGPAAPTDGQSTEPVLDATVLAGLRELDGDGQGSLGGIVTMFFGDTEARVEQLRLALQQGDAGSLRNASHSLKGSSGMFGARRMSALCGQLENVAADGDLKAAGELANQLETEFTAVRDALQREFPLSGKSESR
ncbi:MAG: response regulator, partial [Chloroflexota bacterium]|nr:response regulator [Chloroflexota bacterium]